MLFSALFIARRNSQSDGQDVTGVPDGALGPAFLARAGQALVTGRYQEAKPYSVEAVLLYGYCRYIQLDDPDTDAWMTMGISARLAMRMGYHRDPRHLGNISPFEGEMRRRVFSIIGTFDILLSFQNGLPAIIHEEECDTDLPSNLLDEDFDEDCKVLPPSRPPTDPTPMLYSRYKSQLVVIFRRVVRHALAIQTPPYEETLKLDSQLREMHANAPPSFRMKPLGSSFTDPVHTVLNRLNIEILYLKSLCILHRNYISHGRSNPALEYSQKSCTSAALQLLNHQVELHAESQPGGQFHTDKWMFSSFVSHDFLLAAMITCLDLYESQPESGSTPQEELQARAKQYDVLRLSYDIWASRRAHSRDARRATSVLAVMLSKVPRPNVPSTPVDVPQDLPSGLQTSVNRDDVMAAATHPSGSSCWDSTSFDVSGQELPAEAYAPLAFDSTDPLNAIFAESDNLDWVRRMDLELQAWLTDVPLGPR